LVLRHRRIASAGAGARIFIASAAALAGLVALHSEISNDTPLLDAFYAGCFLGMSAPDRLKGWFQPVLGALVLTGVLILMPAFLTGVGGSLGFAAFVTMALLMAWRRVTVGVAPGSNARNMNFATGGQAAPCDRNHPDRPDHAESRRDGATVDEPERNFAIGRSPAPPLFAGAAPAPLFLHRTSFALVTLTLGATIANAPVAAFLVTGWPPQWNAATFNRLAEKVTGSMGMTASKPATRLSARTSPQLVIANNAAGAAGEAIPLRISLINATSDDIVILNGLPSGSSVTNGRPLATGEWLLVASDLADAAIRPAQDFVGGGDVTVELRREDQTFGWRGLHIEWTAPEPRAVAEATPDPIKGRGASSMPSTTHVVAARPGEEYASPQGRGSRPG